MTEHSSIGPSALHRLLNCPASHQLSATKPKGGGSSPYAAEGSVAHEIVENQLVGVLDERPSVGEKRVYDGHEITVDQEMLDGVDQMVAFCEPLKDAGDLVWVENRVDLAPLWGGNPPEPIFGTVDFGSYNKSTSTLYVVDFKYGRIPVSPQDNPQAYAYALGACYEAGLFPKDVVVVIVQPRGPGVSMSHLTGLDLQLWADEVLKPGVDRLFGPNPTFATGDHCRFCPAKIDCPALYALAKETSRVEFGELPPDPIKLNDEELGKIMDATQVLRWWFDQVQAETSGRIEKGKSVPNWKLVPKRAVRKWDDTTAVEDFFIKKQLDGAFETKLRSPTQIQKNYPTEYDQLENEGQVNKQSSGTTLVPDHDPREAAKTRSAREEFGEL